MLYNHRMNHMRQPSFISMEAVSSRVGDTNADPADMISPEFRYGQLAGILSDARAFYKDQSPLRVQYLDQQFFDFQNIVDNLPGSQGSFGTGYPFYARREDSTVVPIDEVDRYIGEYELAAQDARRRLIGSWACTSCQGEKELPDLKVYCKPCGVVPLKPRDMFKALPDLDFWAITDDITPEYLSTLQSNLHHAGFFQSDLNIGRSLQDTQRAMSLIGQGVMPQERLPIDVHVVSSFELLEALSGVRDIVQSYDKVDPKEASVPISPTSLHVVWTSQDTPYNFLGDYLFSFTPSEISEEVSEAIEQTNSLIHRMLSVQDVYDIVSQNPKVKRILDTSEVRAILNSRWSKCDD